MFVYLYTPEWPLICYVRKIYYAIRIEQKCIWKHKKNNSLLYFPFVYEAYCIWFIFSLRYFPSFFTSHRQIDRKIWKLPYFSIGLIVINFQLYNICENRGHLKCIRYNGFGKFLKGMLGRTRSPSESVEGWKMNMSAAVFRAGKFRKRQTEPMRICVRERGKHNAFHEKDCEKSYLRTNRTSNPYYLPFRYFLFFPCRKICIRDMPFGRLRNFNVFFIIRHFANMLCGRFFDRIFRWVESICY